MRWIGVESKDRRSGGEKRNTRLEVGISIDGEGKEVIEKGKCHSLSSRSTSHPILEGGTPTGGRHVDSERGSDTRTSTDLLFVWILWHPTFLDTELVIPERSTWLSSDGRVSNLKKLKKKDQEEEREREREQGEYTRSALSHPSSFAIYSHAKSRRIDDEERPSNRERQLSCWLCSYR